MKYNIYEDGFIVRKIGERVLRVEDGVKYVKIKNAKYHVEWDGPLRGYVIDWRLPNDN